MTWRFRIAKSFSCNIQDGDHGGNLETLKITSDSGLLKTIWADSQYDHHVLRARRNEKEMKVKPATSFKLLTIFIPQKK